MNFVKFLLEQLSSKSFLVSCKKILFSLGLCKLKDGVAAGAPLGLTSANVFYSFYETKLSEKCPVEYKSVLKDGM